MNPRALLAELNDVRRLTEQGRYPEVVDRLRSRGPEFIERSPTLALFYGIAHGRAGQRVESVHWVDLALNRADDRRDRALHARALNVRGAIALESGRLDEADGFFARALAEARAEGNHATVGRCSNNLGIIANLRGHHSGAVSWYTLALAAFQQAGMRSGVAETENNLRITYRDLAQLDRALECADRAVETAETTGNLPLLASAIAGRAEIRALSGEPEIADREILRAIEIRRSVGDSVGEAEDTRVHALTQAALGNLVEAERLYREAIVRAGEHGRPVLAAEAGRGLAELIAPQGRRSEAADAARAARVQFSVVGAEAEVRRLDDLIESLG